MLETLTPLPKAPREREGELEPNLPTVAGCCAGDAVTGKPRKLEARNHPCQTRASQRGGEGAWESTAMATATAAVALRMAGGRRQVIGGFCGLATAATTER